MFDDNHTCRPKKVNDENAEVSHAHSAVVSLGQEQGGWCRNPLCPECSYHNPYAELSYITIEEQRIDALLRLFAPLDEWFAPESERAP